jgi:hypothetical protein
VRPPPPIQRNHRPIKRANEHRDTPHTRQPNNQRREPASTGVEVGGQPPSRQDRNHSAKRGTPTSIVVPGS